MEMSTEIGILLAYAFGILVLYVIGYMLLMPVKVIGKLIMNSFFGGIFIMLINWIGAYFDFHIPLNVLSAVLVGLLGIPGTIMLAVLEKIFGF